MHFLIKSGILIFTILLTYNESIAQNRFIISEKFDETKTPPIPDFSKDNNWSSRPDLKDMADEIPTAQKKISDDQMNAKADVFFIYPTIYTKTPNNQYLWNAAVDDNILNKEIDETTIKNQASAFNQSCKIYAPRYRQAHYSVFLTEDKESAKNALDLAYEDVKNAFEYYLKNFNQDRPIVIAAHSQGTLHATRLLQDFFDNKPLKKQLAEAYLVGMPVADSLFKEIKEGDFMYFVHSYYVPKCSEAIATTGYDFDYTSALQKDNFYGVQFHPEKSGTIGAQILLNFLKL